jgi:integrase
MPIRFNDRTQKWDADYTDDHGKRHRRGFDKLKEAKAHLLAAESEIKAGSFRAEADRVTVAEVAQLFLKDAEKRVQIKEIDRTSFHNYKGHVARFINGTIDLKAHNRPDKDGEFFHYPIGHFKLKDLRLPKVNRFQQELQGLGLSVSWITAVMGTLCRILDLAVEHEWIAVNVARQAKRVRKRADDKALADTDDGEDDDSDVFIPEKVEVAALCEHSRSHTGPIIWFAAATGLRSSEQRALAWRHIDLDKGVVRVRRRVNRFNEIGQPKSLAGRRTIPLAPGLIAAVRAWKAASRFNGPDDLVFPNGKGNIQAHSNWRRRLFYPAWEKAQTANPDLASRTLWRWHDLRHFAISCWIEAEAPVKQVQKWAGHSSAQMTLDRYGHLFKSVDHSAILRQVEEAVWQR